MRKGELRKGAVVEFEYYWWYQLPKGVVFKIVKKSQDLYGNLLYSLQVKGGEFVIDCVKPKYVKPARSAI